MFSGFAEAAEVASSPNAAHFIRATPVLLETARPSIGVYGTPELFKKERTRDPPNPC
jgi:hypothetical protein